MKFLIPCLFLLPLSGLHAGELWSHLPGAGGRAEVRGLTARVDTSGGHRIVTLSVPELYLAPGEPGHDARHGIGWIDIPPPGHGWDLGRVARIEADMKNIGPKTARTTLWVTASHGWTAVGSAAELKAGETTTLSCDLRATYPDGTPRIDPRRVNGIRIMVQRTDSSELQVSHLVARGTAEPWTPPAGRLEVPDMTEGEPAPGRRVRYRLPGDADQEIYGALYLPPDWEAGKRYPVVAEFPGNIYFSAEACWSTGRPEQCVVGYGMTSGKGAIWISLPFVDRPGGRIAESGFGSDAGLDTAAHAFAVMEDLCAHWGGDRDRLFLSGFSRGAVACGYIGLRNDKIARLWKGFVACQHYDGTRWRGSRMEDAVRRAPRFQGAAIFQVDNKQEKFQPVVDATDPAVRWTWADSGLGYHSTAMFLDDRPMMIKLRKWWRTHAGSE